VLENVVLAPLVSVLAFVCSVGNVPLAAALWGHGVAFGGVIAFLFADLVTLPLLVIYRRYYGTATAWRLFALLWLTASGAGLAIDGVFRVVHLIPNDHHVKVLSGEFPLGATLVLNVLAAIVLVVVWRLARGATMDHHLATDPICGMTVDPANAPASAHRDGETFYFCSLGCRDKFLARGREDATRPGGHVDPVCGMSVASDGLTGVGPDGATYYFCSEGCRETFIRGASPANHHHE
jgi:YHS domain-containing protein